MNNLPGRLGHLRMLQYKKANLKAFKTQMFTLMGQHAKDLRENEFVSAVALVFIIVMQ